MSDCLQEVRFVLTRCSVKEAKKKFCSDADFYIVDIGKIIRDLGYDTSFLSRESEFIINYSVQKKILQGIYSTRCSDILVVYKNISDDFVDNLKEFLDSQSEDGLGYAIEIL
jgi:hypothetical protein